MCNFSCKMHLLVSFVNFATEADKVLKVDEGDIAAEGKNHYALGSKSGGAKLVQTAAKAFTSHGSHKSGMAADWETYLEELGKTTIALSHTGGTASTYCFTMQELHTFIATICSTSSVKCNIPSFLALRWMINNCFFFKISGF